MDAEQITAALTSRQLKMKQNVKDRGDFPAEARGAAHRVSEDTVGIVQATMDWVWQTGQGTRSSVRVGELG